MGNLCPKSDKDEKVNYFPKQTCVQISYPRSNEHFVNTAYTEKPTTPPPPLQPLPPPTPMIQVCALYNFDAINEDDLSFKRGDLMEVEESMLESEDWWMAVHCKTLKRGYIPSNYVMRYGSEPEFQDWWFEYDRKESNKMLLLPGNIKGTFLVRQSSEVMFGTANTVWYPDMPALWLRDKASCVLSVRDCDKENGEPHVKHYRIRKLDNGGYFINAKRPFPSLLDLINHHRGQTDGLCCRLTASCPRIRPVVRFRDLEISRDAIKLTEKLGAGCFGEVWKGTLRKVVDVAVKTLKPGQMTSEAFLNEAKIMHKLIHPKLVQLMAVVSVTQPFYIITELMVNGALLDFLHSNQGKKLKFDHLVEKCSEIAEGMAYLESVNFVHRDLRAANILVGYHFDVKVADFGLARMLESDQNVYEGNENSKFPIKWTAPEAALEMRFSIKSDVWSFGVLMYEIVTYGKVPYPGMSNSEVLHMIEKGERMSKPVGGPVEVPDFYFDKMLKCWHKNPDDRPTFESLWNFFNDYFVSIEPNYRIMDDM